MQLSGIREQMEQQQKELVDTLREERAVILMEFERMMKKQKEEIIDAFREELRTSFTNKVKGFCEEAVLGIDNLRADIITKIDKAEDNIYKDMCRAVSLPQK